ncbi:hypothetical protein [Ruegeria sp. HKCCA0370]|uniref:hypothetical protein n=1 Tax=Ruegeria sp. HKCCA0370 TaxID=2682995 RepID=UPI001488E197|nr:hypothetical protein [Ruegeria sp. HKCCA0370]
MKDKLVRCVSALGLLLASSVSAQACASDLMFTFFLHKNPEAQKANTAILEADENGILVGEQWEKSVGLSLHAWRAQKTEFTIRALQHRMKAASNSTRDMSNAHLFLMREFTWLDLKSGGDGMTVSRTPPRETARMSTGAVGDALLIYTTRRVLDTLLAGEMTLDVAIEKGLITSNCGSQCPGDPFGALAVAMAEPQQKAELGLD